jgi:hypothetical protein
MPVGGSCGAVGLDLAGRQPLCRKGDDHLPPHRPTAPEATQTLTLIWYPDGVVDAPYESVPEDARTVLYGCRFQYSPHESAFVLPASCSTSNVQDPAGGVAGREQADDRADQPAADAELGAKGREQVRGRV